MNILERIGVTISANINALIDKVEDPVAVLEKLVRDMEKDYSEAKAQVVRAIADEKKLGMKFEKATELRNEWERKAELAVGKNDDALAREALRRMKEQSQLAEVYGSELESHRQGSDALKTSLKALEAKMDEARCKKNLLVAKHTRAKAATRLQETMSGIGGRKSAASLFNRAEDRIEDLEARAAASRELESADIESQFAQLERGDAVDSELEALKARMKQKSVAAS